MVRPNAAGQRNGLKRQPCLRVLPCPFLLFSPLTKACPLPFYLLPQPPLPHPAALPTSAVPSLTNLLSAPALHCMFLQSPTIKKLLPLFLPPLLPLPQ